MLPERIADSVEVSEDGCWLWKGGLTKAGYGAVRATGYKSRRAHRVMWEICNGHIPRGMYVCHKCDVRNCINPDHLFLGTPKDNMEDRDRKGRGTSAKLTPEQVLEIRSEYDGSESLRRIASRYGVTHLAIFKIVHNQSWKHLLEAA